MGTLTEAEQSKLRQHQETAAPPLGRRRSSRSMLPGADARPESGGSLESSRKKKTLVVRRRKDLGESATQQQMQNSGEAGSFRAPGSAMSDFQNLSRSGTPRKVLLARKVRPGESINLTDSPNKVTINAAKQPEDLLKAVVPESVITGGLKAGPKVSADGKIVPRTVLGKLEDYETFGREELRGVDENSMAGSPGPEEGDPMVESLKSDKKSPEPLHPVRNRSPSVAHSIALSASLKSGQSKTKPPTTLDIYRSRLMTQDILKNQLQDMKKRQIEDVEAKQKNLRKLKISDRLQVDRDERALARWEEMNVEWDKFKTKMASKLGKNVDQLVISRAEEYREKVEEYNKMDKATPIHLKFGPDNWEMSLRDAWTKYAQIGNVFSGLYAPVLADKGPKVVEYVRKPSVAAKMATEEYKSKSFRNSEAFIARQKRMKKNLEKHFPFDPSAEGLELKGEHMFKEERFQCYMKEDEIVMNNLPEAEAVPQLEGSLDTGGHTTSTMTACATVEGPAMSDYEKDIVWTTYVGEVQKKQWEVKNTGSTALYYLWKKAEKNDAFVTSTRAPPVQRFFQFDQEGVILPGETHSFHFMFKSNTTGMFKEQWELQTKPQVKNGNFPFITLRATAIEDDDDSLNRSDLGFQLTKNQAIHTIQDIIHEVVDGIRTPVESPRAADDVNVNEELFVQQNNSMKIFYTPEMYERFSKLADDTFEALDFPVDDRRWDSSVGSIHDLVQQIPDEDTRSNYVKDLNTLIKRASIEPKEQSLMYQIGYELLVELAEETEAVALRTKEALGLEVESPEAAAEAGKDGKDAKGKKEAKPKKDAKKGKPKKGEEEEEGLTPREMTEEEREAASQEYKFRLELQVYNLMADAMDRFELLCNEAALRTVLNVVDEDE